MTMVIWCVVAPNRGPATVQRGARRHSSSCSSAGTADLGSEDRSCHTYNQDCRCSYVTRREDNISRACERVNSNAGGKHGTKSSDDVNTDQNCYSCEECGKTFTSRERALMFTKGYILGKNRLHVTTVRHCLLNAQIWWLANWYIQARSLTNVMTVGNRLFVGDIWGVTSWYI